MDRSAPSSMLNGDITGVSISLHIPVNSIITVTTKKSRLNTSNSPLFCDILSLRTICFLHYESQYIPAAAKCKHPFSTRLDRSFPNTPFTDTSETGTSKKRRSDPTLESSSLPALFVLFLFPISGLRGVQWMSKTGDLPQAQANILPVAVIFAVHHLLGGVHPTIP